MAAPELIRILIVEDDEDDFVITRDLLAEQEHTHFEVEWASNPSDARKLIEEDRFDLYLIDHRLGVITGLDLVREAFGGQPHAPVIMLTGHADYEVDLEATMLGVTDFLVKDRLDGSLLERSIRYAVRHHTVLNELRESQDRYALAVMGANDGIWDWNLTTGEVYFGPRWKEILGHRDAEIGASPDEWFDRVHPENLGRLRAALDAHLEGRTTHFENEHRIKHADGSYRWVLSRALAVRDRDGGATRIAGSMSDITDRKDAEERLLHDARHDSLTGLLNRTMFLDHLGLSLRRAERDADYHCAVLFLDLNRFKLVNDGFSHAVGDQLLRSLARRLRRSIRPGDTVARFGGDEFTILLHDVESVDAALEVAERVLEALSKPFRPDGRDLRVTGSIGIALNEPESTAAELMRNADIAMYHAKHETSSDVSVFDRSMRNRLVGQLQIESMLREAIETGRLRVFYQPIIEIETGAIIGFEALARWPADAEPQISPIEFIPVAEDTGLIRPLGRLVLAEACARLSAWRDAALVAPEVTVSVNISGRELGEPELVDDVLAALKESTLPASGLRLEVTEGSIMRDPERMPTALDELEGIGVGAHIDDFGTGYSSLIFLRHFAGNTLKIDRSFIASVCDDQGSAEIVRTIIALSQNLDLDVIAEGVETPAQLRKLHELGGRRAQGFLFAEPLAPDRIETLLAGWDASAIAVLAAS